MTVPTEIIATIKLAAYAADGERTPVHVQLWKPYPEDEHWRCPVSCTPWLTKPVHIGGVDAFDTLAMAISLVRQLLDAHIEKGGTIGDADGEAPGRGWRQSLDARFGGLQQREAWSVRRIFAFPDAKVRSATWNEGTLTLCLEGYLYQWEEGPGFGRSSGWQLPVEMTLTGCEPPARLPEPGTRIEEGTKDRFSRATHVPVARDEPSSLQLVWNGGELDLRGTALTIAANGPPRFREEPGREPPRPKLPSAPDDEGG